MHFLLKSHFFKIKNAFQLNEMKTEAVVRKQQFYKREADLDLGFDLFRKKTKKRCVKTQSIQCCVMMSLQR